MMTVVRRTIVVSIVIVSKRKRAQNRVVDNVAAAAASAGPEKNRHNTLSVHLFFWGARKTMIKGLKGDTLSVSALSYV